MREPPAGIGERMCTQRARAQAHTREHEQEAKNQRDHWIHVQAARGPGPAAGIHMFGPAGQELVEIPGPQPRCSMILWLEPPVKAK